MRSSSCNCVWRPGPEPRRSVRAKGLAKARQDSVGRVLRGFSIAELESVKRYGEDSVRHKFLCI